MKNSTADSFTSPTLVHFCALLSLAVVLSWAAVPPLNAQTMTSSFTGVVSDPSGAVIPAATVTLTNEATASKRTAATDSSGNYRIDGVLPGTYSIEVAHTGFRSFRQTGIAVTPALVKELNVSLQVGQTQQVVEVTSSTPVIETNNATLSATLPSTVYKDKPLVTMSRGALLPEQLVWAPGFASGNASYRFQGATSDMQQFNVEGLQIANPLSASVTASGLENVSAVVSNAPAEYARPVTVNATLRSGTNQLHGEYWRAFVNPCLNATNTPFSQPKRPPCGTVWRQYVNVGGPVYIPGLYNGKNKTFFFFSWGHPNSFNSILPSVSANTPTLAMQSGDFSQYPKIVTDPTTGLPFAGNIIPRSRINPFALGVIKTFYGSNLNYVGAPSSFKNNTLLSQQRYRKDTDWLTKIDQNIGTKDILSVFYQRHQVISNNTQAQYNPQFFDLAFQDSVGNWSSGTVWTHTFTPTILNEFRSGLTRFVFPHNLISKQNIQSGTVLKGADFLSQWSIGGITAPDLSGIPLLSISSWQQMNQSLDLENASYNTNWATFDNLSFIRGRHTFKTGFAGTKYISNTTRLGPYFGSFDFSGQFSGEPFADFLLGLPDTFTRYSNGPTSYLRNWEFGAFFQDDFRLNNNLNITYGLRWEKLSVPYDKNGLYYTFDPKTFSIVVPDQRALSYISPSWPAQSLPIKTASQVGYPSKLINGSQNWEPRVGFGYNFTPKTVLRGGFGVYIANEGFAFQQTRGPFALTQTWINQAANTSTGALYSMPNPFPPTVNTTPVASITGLSKDFRQPYSMQWNLTLDRQIATNWGIHATYRGVKDTQVLWLNNLNAVQASTTPFSQTSRPYPNFQTLGFWQNGANDWYDAIQIQVTHPFANGLYTTAAYTREWSQLAPTSPEYVFNPSRDIGPDPAYPSHDLIWNWVWDLPLGSNKRFAHNTNKYLNAVIGNWTLNGAFSWRSGWFFTPVLQGVDPGNIGNTSGRRPNLVAGCDPMAGGGKIFGGYWFNPACYTIPPAGQLGNAGVNSLVGPGAWQVNLSPYKAFPIPFPHHEGAKLQIGANIYNLFNNPHFAPPVNIVNSPTGGQVLSTGWSRAINNDEGSGQRQMIIDLRAIF